MTSNVAAAVKQRAQETGQSRKDDADSYGVKKCDGEDKRVRTFHAQVSLICEHDERCDGSGAQKDCAEATSRDGGRLSCKTYLPAASIARFVSERPGKSRFRGCDSYSASLSEYPGCHAAIILHDRDFKRVDEHSIHLLSKPKE